MTIENFILKFAEAIEVEEIENLNPETEFRLLDEWSSISIMLAIAFFDEEFEKEITSLDIKGCSTLRDLYNLVSNQNV